MQLLRAGGLVGIAHYLFHRGTTRLDAEEVRGRGIGRQLIQAVYAAARAAGSSRVYWQTQAENAPGRGLYDKVAEQEGFIVYSREL
jgi:GNAT superfamily N-acetyltransferase